MKKNINIQIGLFLCLLTLSACHPAPRKTVPVDADGTSSVSENVIASAARENTELIRNVNGSVVEKTITTAAGKKIVFNARVNTENVEGVQRYEYTPLPVTDELRKALFTARFGARASEAVYDQINDMWELYNSEDIGDFYLYSHRTVSTGDEGFILDYHDVNLCPYEENLLSSPEECNVTLPMTEVLSMCAAITDAIAPQDGYTADTVLPYGSLKGHPFYKVFFRRHADGMPITGYNDIYFMVDSNGIQCICGALYSLVPQPLTSPLLSLEEAMTELQENASLVNFYDEDHLSIGAVSMEYIVIKTKAQKVTTVVPAWRFQIGSDDDSLMINRRKILAVNAITGELIQGKRGMNS